MSFTIVQPGDFSISPCQPLSPRHKYPAITPTRGTLCHHLLSLQALITLPFALIVAVTALLAIFILRDSYRNAINDLANQQLLQMTHQAKDEVLFSLNNGFNQARRWSYYFRGYAEVPNFTYDLLNLLLSQLAMDSYITGLGGWFSFVNEVHFGSSAQGGCPACGPNESVESYWYPPLGTPNRSSYEYFFDQSGKYVVRTVNTSAPNYRPTLRPWFTSVRPVPDDAVWNLTRDVTNNVTQMKATICCSMFGLYKFLGVSCVRYYLVQLTQLLSILRLPPKSFAILVDEDRQVMGSSFPDIPLTIVSSDQIDAEPGASETKQNRITIIRIDNFPTESVRNLDKYFGGKNLDIFGKPTLLDLGERYYVSSATIITDARDLKWTLFIGITENTFLGLVRSREQTAIIMACCLSMGTVLLGILGIQIVLRPLKILSNNLVKLASNLDVDQMTCTDESFRPVASELRVLHTAFTSMMVSLDTFARYVPMGVVQGILKHGGQTKLYLEFQEITVVFLDLKNFTKMATELSPNDLAIMIGEALGAFSKCFMREGGNIDKYIGDAIMALFGAPDPLNNHVFQACKSMIECEIELEYVNKRLAKYEMPALDFRIGANAGKAMVGNVGSTNRYSYTAIGDVVNVAARLEPANKQFYTRILVTAEMASNPKASEFFHFREIGLIKLIGREIPVHCYELLSISDGLDLWNEAISLTKDQLYESAIKVLKKAGLEGPYKVLEKRLKECMLSPTVASNPLLWIQEGK